MPASLGCGGANPAAWSWGAFGWDCQSLLLSTTAWSDSRTRVMTGLANGLAMPKLESEGPVATIATVLGAEPPITKPPIITSLPVRTTPRVLMFPRRGGPLALIAANVAVTLRADVTLEIVQLVPEHAPLQPVKTKPTFAVAVQVVELPCGTGLGEQLTVPPVPGLELVVTAYVTAVKFAVTLFAAVTFESTQFEPLQSPLQLLNVKPALGVAVQVLLPPWLTGLLVQLTVPPPAGFAEAVIG
jgi:hypothetical protein